MTSKLYRTPGFKPAFFSACLTLMVALPFQATAATEPKALPAALFSALPANDQASGDAKRMLVWIKQQADNAGKPFAIVDKKNARLLVFAADGRLYGATPVLLGAGLGDTSPPGIGTRDLSSLRPDEQTTPAGRFVSEPGVNLQGEDIVWVDYAAKVAIHRLRDGVSYKSRVQRLASGSLDDKRVSLGCIVVPVQFYDSVVRPMLGKSYGVVYVLPETKPIENLLSALQGASGL